MLHLNLQVKNLSSGEADGATRIIGVIDKLDIEMTRTGESTSEIITLAWGPMTIDFDALAVEGPNFAGTFPFPAGEVHEVRWALDTAVDSSIWYGTDGPHRLRVDSPASQGLVMAPATGTGWQAVSGDYLHLLGELDMSDTAGIAASDCGSPPEAGCKDIVLTPPIPTKNNPLPVDASFHPDHLYVAYAAGTTLTQKQNLESAIGAALEWEDGNGLRKLKMPSPDWFALANAAAKLWNDSIVEAAWPQIVVRPPSAPDDPYYPEETNCSTCSWGQHHIWSTGTGDLVQKDAVTSVTTTTDIDDAWEEGTGSRSVIVALIDTGIDQDHPDLVNNLWINAGEIPASMQTDFDFDGDGFFTLHDMNMTLTGSNLTDRNTKIASMNSTQTALGRSFTAAGGDDTALREATDIITAFADGSDDYSAGTSTDVNTVVDDIFGATFFRVNRGSGDIITGAVTPYDDPDCDRDNDNVCDGLSPYHGEHGTFTAGIVGAEGDNGAIVSGMSQKVRIMEVVWGMEAQGPWDVDGDGTKENGDGIDSIIAGIAYAESMGADIIIIEGAALSAVHSPTKTLSDGACRAAVISAEQARLSSAGGDAFLVAAAGNDGADCDADYCWPASLDLSNMVSVGATLRGSTALASQSSYGAVSIDIAAPGQDLPTTRHRDARPFNPTAYASNTDGTSMAIAVVGGGAALLVAQDATLTGADIKQHVLDGASPESALYGDVASSRYFNSCGMLYDYDAQLCPPGP